MQAGNKITPFFPSCVGVRQGDNLSPTLFNLFVSDLPLIFDTLCSPAKFGEMTLHCLTYADDLAIFSETKAGLQRSMDCLAKYCNTWGLKVNPSKSNFMCISSTPVGLQTSEISFDSIPLSRVSSYRYLGVLFDNTGSHRVMRDDLYKRSLKAYFKLVRALNPQPKVSTLLHLFDRLIKPINNV